MEKVIYQVIESFYQKAILDILIGYHFKALNNPHKLTSHLERIAAFWELKLLGSTTFLVEPPFDLFFTHQKLNIKRGEIGRWVMLFNQELNKHEDLHTSKEVKELLKLWKIKILDFEQLLVKNLFPQSPQ